MPEFLGDAFWWLGRLYDELAVRQADLEQFNNYYEGRHALPFLTEAHEAKMSGEFNMLLDESRSNFMRLVVDAVEERLNVEGFRLSSSTDEASDEEAWRIWQSNELDSQVPTAFIESVVMGVSYFSVWKAPEAEMATIAIEDPRQTIVGYVPGSNYRQRAAALKVWTDDFTGDLRANVYLPDGIYKFVSRDESMRGEPVVTVTDTADELTFEGPRTPGGSIRVDVAAAPRMGKWVFLADEFVENVVGTVPIIPLRNRPRARQEGQSELKDVISIQNQINGFLFLLALAGYFGAHKQRWAIGLPIMEDKRTGKPVEPFKTAIDTLWASSDPGTKFGEFSATELDGYLKAIEQKVQHIAVITRTPRHYLIPEGQEPSGDSIRSAEAGLVMKVLRKQRTFADGLEATINLARVFNGEENVPPDSEVLWGDPQVRSEAEITDAAIKKFKAQLITKRQALVDLGYSQSTIAKILAAADDEFATPPPTPGAPAAPEDGGVNNEPTAA